ncbi:hypothetical protein [Mycobacterium sp. OAE908]|uniref:hypothetical protein n=1 Tax=Mycobacterium sp. OAE908 TaxID=2817899 RepID=UPI001AE7DCCB
MRSGFCKICMPALGIAVATSVAGCGGTAAPGGVSSPTGPPVDPNVAFEQYMEATKPFQCSKAYLEMFEAFHDKHYGIMKDRARQHRDVVAAWDAQLSKIAFPVAAQPIVGKIREFIATELPGLNELVEADDKDTRRMWTVMLQVQVDDSSATLEGDHLRETLGHPEAPAWVAADQLDLAHLTFYKEIDPVAAKWQVALAAKDLDGAKAAQAMEIDALQRYIDKLDTISWPPGTFEGQANTLRKHLLGMIEFDRHQVDVATTAQIVRTPEEGAPEMAAANDAQQELWNVLARTGAVSSPVKCS